jgi:hypothetical protein
LEAYALHKARRAAAYVQFDPCGEDGPDVMLHVCVPFVFSFYLTVCTRLGRLFGDHREVGVQFHGGAVWFHPCTTVDNWESRWPWWRRGVCWHYLDTLLGERRCTLTTLGTYTIRDVVPAGRGYEAKEYTFHVKVLVRDASRPRWLPDRFMATDTSVVEGGVPLPGKGENSWDCGEDARHSVYTPWTSLISGPDDYARYPALQHGLAIRAVYDFIAGVVKDRAER